MAMPNFDDVLVGDMVIVKTQNSEQVVTTVARVTAKQFETKSPKIKFWKKNGDQVNRGTWYTSWAKKGSPEEMKEVYAKQQLRAKARKAKCMAHDAQFQKMSSDTLDAIINILERENEALKK
jgi:hypothetical protein